MIIKQIKLSNAAKDKLSRLKGKREFKIGTYYAVGHFAFRLKKGQFQQILKSIRIAMLKCLGLHLQASIMNYMKHLSKNGVSRTISVLIMTQLQSILSFIWSVASVI